MDQARNILNSYIPATQYAINYLNQQVGKSRPGEMMMSAIPGGQQIAQNILKPLGMEPPTVNQLGQDVQNQGAALKKGDPSALMGLVSGAVDSPRDVLGRFTVDKGSNVAVHPMDIQEVAAPLERLLTTDPTDANYHINQKPVDFNSILPIAEHYLPGVSKTLKNDPIDIARALLQRIMVDRK